MTKTAIRFTELVKKGYSIEDILRIDGEIAEEHAIKFLSDNFQDPDVKKFLTSYYDQYRVDSDKVIIISDTHLGGIYGNYDLVYGVYNFALQSGIKYILHAGDIIEGYVNDRIESPIAYDQVRELQEKYPKIDEIKTYYILGNHDYMSVVSNQEKEIFAPHLVKDTANNINGLTYAGVFQTYINFNDQHRIMLKHSDGWALRFPNLEHDLILKGHSHKYYIQEQSRMVSLPALKNRDYTKTENIGFVVLSLLDDCYEIKTYTSDNNYYSNTDTKRLVYKRKDNK